MRKTIAMIIAASLIGCTATPPQDAQSARESEEAYCRYMFPQGPKFVAGKYKLVDRATFESSKLLAIVGMLNQSGEFQIIFRGKGKGVAPNKWPSSMLLFQAFPDRFLACVPQAQLGDGVLCAPLFWSIQVQGNESRLEHSLCITNEVMVN